jgi:pimeloyl-ACP methyl ester carboxylesterase
MESAHDVDDVRKALGVEKLNLVGFSYGTHLGLACIRYHGENLNRVALVGTEGPDHTNKLPFTSDASLKRLAQLAAAAPELQGKVPDLFEMLRDVLNRLEKEPVTVQITDQRSRKPIEVKVGKSGLQFLIMRGSRRYERSANLSRLVLHDVPQRLLYSCEVCGEKVQPVQSGESL